MVLVAAGVVLGLVANALSSDRVSVRYAPPHLESEWPVATYQDMVQHLENGTALFLDAREPEEFEQGHLPGAINFPSSQLQDSYETIGVTFPRDEGEALLIVYCQGDPCEQSHDVLDYLRKFEFENLMIYLGGWNEWRLNQQNGE
jgi:3-mercaptopyruvate sulfurtransferase SseA